MGFKIHKKMATRTKREKVERERERERERIEDWKISVVFEWH
jgi:hypothetical protein